MGSHVACRSACEWNKILDRQTKMVLDRLIAPFQGSWLLDFMGVQRTKRSHAFVVSKKVFWLLILVAKNSSWSLDWFQKRALITWFHFDPGCKCFYRRRICDYPLMTVLTFGSGSTNERATNTEKGKCYSWDETSLVCRLLYLPSSSTWLSDLLYV